MRHRAKFRKDTLNRSGDMADFRFFKMAAAAILDFGNFKFFTVVTLKRVELRLRAKFCRNRSNRSCDMAIFQFLKMAAVRHLGFLKAENFNFRSGSETHCASLCQISRRSVETFRRYGRFSIFKTAAVHHLGFDFTHVVTNHEDYLVVFMTVQNLVVIGAVISIVCKF